MTEPAPPPSPSPPAAPATAVVVCPQCGTRLRFAVPGPNPARLRLTCGGCQASFPVQWQGAGGTSVVPANLTPSAVLAAQATPAGGSMMVSLPDKSSDAAERTTPLRVSMGGGAFEKRAPTFSPDDVLAGRYRVVRFLAEGGMGEVFEVEDLVLGGRLAAKTVRAELAHDASALERFRREIQLARRVTHPNVCRIFDVAEHTNAGDARGGMLFLTMELLLGETLSDRLKREGPWAPADALPIVRQIAAALDAAHQAGVVHRDLKPGNVVLVPAENSRASRAVVTDFGLARPATPEDDRGHTMTAAGFVIGTPAYVSPEQVEGGEIGPAVDVYAFGILLYEMLTGEVPFVGTTPIATAVKRLHEPPPSPRLKSDAIDVAWESAILRCLERKPEARFASAGAAVAAIDAGPSGNDGRQPLGEVGAVREPPQRPSTDSPERSALLPPRSVGEDRGGGGQSDRGRRKGVTVALLALVLVSFGVVAYRIVAWRKAQAARELLLGASVSSEPVKARRAVAVLGFEDRSGRAEAAWLSGALAEMLATELAAGRELRVIPGEEVVRMKRDLALDNRESLAADTLTRVRTAIGADFIVLGSYTALGAEGGGKIRLDVKLQDARPRGAATVDSTTAAIAETGTEAALFDLVAKAGARLRKELGVTGTGGAGNTGNAAPRAVNPEATKLYLEGLEQLRNAQPQAARELLERAVALDPENPLSHSGLAAAWQSLGFGAKAAEEAKLAFERARDLPQEDRLAIEGRYRESIEDWPRAIEIYQALFRAYPDDLEIGLRLAAAQNAGGRAAEADGTIAALRALPSPAREDPRVDLAEAATAEALADFARQQKAATRGASEATARGSKRLAASARLSECRALRNLGRVDAASAACEAGRALFAAAGDRAGEADARLQEANLRFDRGDLAGARRMFEEALTTFRTLGDKGAEAGALNNVAVVLRRQGAVAEALASYEQVLALARETGNRRGEANTLNNLGALKAARAVGDDLTQARELCERSLAIRREIADRAGEAASLDNLGAVLRRLGELTAARRSHEEALELRRTSGQKAGEVASLNGLAATLLDQGELALASARFQEALALGDKLGNKSLAATSRFGLAEVAARRGESSAAIRDHEAALAVRGELGERAQEAASRAALARALVDLSSSVAGDVARAESLATAAAEEFGRQGMAVDQAAALSTLAEAQFARGAAALAKATIARAQAALTAANTRDVKNRLAVDLRSLRIAPKTGDEARLAAALSLAEKSGLAEARLEAGLALARLDSSRGRQAEAKNRASALAREAESKGFSALARKLQAVGGS